MTSYDVVIGLEIHAQLQTESKLFCSCPTGFDAGENMHTCPVCTGMPGALPVLNQRAVDLAIRAGVALECTINRRSIWARKNYFYPDLPKGYQITQFEEPYASGGHLEFVVPGSAADGSEDVAKRVRLTRIHMEEDAGKSVHSHERSSLDYNRACTPLVEIVTEPDLTSADEAAAFVRTVRRILRYVDACDGNMEEGSLRCDANVSLKPAGRSTLGTRTEIKNINSFRFIKDAVEYEIARQRECLLGGGEIRQETRLWDSQKKVTRPMRSKEEAHDYRYFPDPDLPPLLIEADTLAAVRQALPTLPQQRCDRYTGIGLALADARVLTEDRDVADFYDDACAAADNPKAVANWVINELLRELKDAPIGELAVKPQAIGELVGLIDKQVISGKIAKTVFGHLLEHGGSPAAIVDRLGLKQITDVAGLEQIVDGVIGDSPKQVEQYRQGKTKIIGYLVGQVMKRSQGKANPAMVNSLLQKKLADE